MRNVARPVTIPLKIWLAYQVREFQRGSEGAKERRCEGARERGSEEARKRGSEEPESEDQVSEEGREGKREGVME